MAEARKGSGGRRAGGTATKRTAAARKGTQARSRKPAAAAKPAARTTAARKGTQARGRKPAAAAKPAAEFSGKSVADLRNALTKGVISPLNIVMLTRERIDEAMEDAVSRGRMTADDAQKLAQDLVTRGRKQTNEVMRDLEQLLNRSRTEVKGVRKRGTAAAGRARKQVSEATAKARSAADPVLAQADRARRVAGVGPNFPITGYDDLTVSQIQKRLGTLKPAELRKVRDYEKRHANRKGILNAVEGRLG
jgi:polyhydroxyalkanoate synthesis regulator phasin